MTAQVRRSLCHFLTDNTKQAVDDIEIINELDPDDHKLTRAGLPSNFLRLRDGYRSGRLYATKNELKLFPPERRIELVLAEILLETERWGDALAAYHRFARKHHDAMSMHERAYIEYATAMCLSMESRDAEAIQKLKRFEKEFFNTPTWPRATLMMADHVIVLEKKIDLFQSVYERLGRKGDGLTALLRIGENYYTRQKYSEAREAFLELKEAAPGTWMATGADHYLADIVRERNLP